MLCPSCTKLAHVPYSKKCIRCNGIVHTNLSVLCDVCSQINKQCAVCLKNVIPDAVRAARKGGCGCSGRK